MSTLSTIKIPQQVYVGFQGRRTVDEVPLGFMTPYEDTAAGKKRQATVDDWAKPSHYQTDVKAFNSIIIDNKPMVGFKIGRAIRRSSSFGGTSTVVRIEDPRGFELEIGVENLVMLLNANIMEDCELMQECLWGREGARNILLPINSEPYKEYLQTQELINNKVSLKDVQIGDVVKILGGKEGMYLGGMHFATRTSEHDYSVSNCPAEIDIQIVNKKRYVVRYEEGQSISYMGEASIRIERIVKKAAKPLTQGEVYKMIDDDKKSSKFTTMHSTGGVGNIFTWVYDPKMTIDKSLERIPVTLTELQAAWSSYNYACELRHRSFILMIRDGVEMVSVGDYNFGSSGRNTSPTHKGKRSYIGSNRGSGYHYYNQPYTYTDGFVGRAKATVDKFPLTFTNELTHFPDENVEFFKINMIVKLGNGYQFTVPA
jgi:hypothetical protein